jgi:aminoglycoside phosphotransferase (APT) family kinase protein
LTARASGLRDPAKRFDMNDWKAQFESAESFSRGHVRCTSSGFVLKRERQKGRSAQEYRATSVAKQLLPMGIVPYDFVGCAGEFFISNRIPGRPLNIESEEEVIAAARLLGALHSAPLSDTTRRFLKEHGFHHYYRRSLQNRLFDEVDRIDRTFGGAPQLDTLSQTVKRLAARRAFKQTPVLGHGDYHRPNLLFHAGHVYPVDWVDFGLCHRFYELAHFRASVAEEHREAVTGAYARCCGLQADKIRTQLAEGEAVDAVIRAGGVARRISPDNEAELRQRFQEHVSRFWQAMRLIR